MNPSFHAEFLQSIGHTIREHAGTLWFDSFSRAWTTIPYDAPVDPRQFSAAELLQRDGVMARYSCDVEDGVHSYQHVVTDANYDFPALISRARNKTRQGLKHCTVSEIDPTELGEAGVRLHAETLIRQGRRLPHDFESYWAKYFAAASKNDCASVWAAYHEGELAAFLISFRANSTEYVSIVRSSQAMLKFKPNNALLFSFLKHTMARPEIDEVSIGLQSLQPGGESLDLFKRGMGFQERSIGQRIELCGSLAATLPRGVASLAAKTLKVMPGGERQARLSGALKWYAKQPKLRPARAA